MREKFIIAMIALVCGVALAECDDCGSVPVGPTLQLEYNNNGLGNNVDVFMYFVPLVAPTSIDIFKDPNTTLNARILSRTSKNSKSEFTTTCTFEITGSGSHETFFDPNEMIAFNEKHSHKLKAMRNMLKSIRIDGPLLGSIEISGTLKNNQRQVNLVKVRFDKSGKSSVTAHLYDINKTSDGFLYSNRFNEQMARINFLSFERGGTPPQMYVEVSSVGQENSKEGFFSSFKAMLANWFIPPMPITTIGSETMMNFGLALDSTNPSFTFPYAQNLRQSLTVLLAKVKNSDQSIAN